MRRSALFLLPFPALLLLPAAVAAQEAEMEQPGTIVVSQNICQDVSEANEWGREIAGPVLDELVAEGRLLGWGILNHGWGDEWNFVIYYAAEDIPAFHTAFGEFFSRATERHPDFLERLESNCTRHKDNIYRVVIAR